MELSGVKNDMFNYFDIVQTCEGLRDERRDGRIAVPVSCSEFMNERMRDKN